MAQGADAVKQIYLSSDSDDDHMFKGFRFDDYSSELINSDMTLVGMNRIDSPARGKSHERQNLHDQRITALKVQTS